MIILLPNGHLYSLEHSELSVVFWGNLSWEILQFGNLVTEKELEWMGMLSPVGAEREDPHSLKPSKKSSSER